jgi:hypothetical protein
MVQTRLLITAASAFILIFQVRVATRYAVCRRQFRTLNGKKEERKLLDYQTHMAILGPHLATGFIINFATLMLTDLSEKAQK